MSLLEEIQEAAVDSGSDISIILRKCKLLAARLGSQPLENWLLWESNGYPEDVDVPEYRIWSLEVKGYFLAPYGSGIREAPIPWACLPKNIREEYIRYKFRQSIASVEKLLRDHEGQITISTGDLAVELGAKVYKEFNCHQAWAEFNVCNLVELLNAVRNRILDFTIAIWKEAPNIEGIVEKPVQNIEPQRVTQIFYTTVYGGTATLVGNATDTSISIHVFDKDFSSLEHFLRNNSVVEDDIKALQIAVKDDGELSKEKTFGPSVSSWIGNMVKKAANGSWEVGIGVAATMLAQALMKYYGLL